MSNFLQGVQFLARRPQLHRNPAGHHQERRAAEPDLCEWLRVIEDQGRKTNKLNLKASADYMDEKPITQMELGTDWSSLRLALICDRRHFVRTGAFVTSWNSLDPGYHPSRRRSPTQLREAAVRKFVPEIG